MGKIPTIRVTREEMRKRVALFSELKGSDGGLPDSRYPSAVRKLYNVIGFQPPEGDPDMHSPVGANSAENAAIKINEGFNLGMCETSPGKGPMMHNHDTNETFMPLTGRWRCSWEVDGHVEAFELGPRDVISFPAGVHAAGRVLARSHGRTQSQGLRRCQRQLLSPRCASCWRSSRRATTGTR